MKQIISVLKSELDRRVESAKHAPELYVSPLSPGWKRAKPRKK